MSLVRDATKKAGTQKVFPPFPPRPPLHPPPKKIKNVIQAGGTGGHPFYSTLQLSRFFRCSVGSTSVGCGDISLCRKDCLNRTGLSQAPPLCSIGKAATSMLPPLPPLYFIFQNEYASYTGRSGRASLRSRRLAGR